MLYQIVGWMGAFFYIISYFLLSRGILRQEGNTYHALNLGGAVCLMVNAVHFKDHANLAVNGVWAAIALMALYKYGAFFFRNRS